MHADTHTVPADPPHQVVLPEFESGAPCLIIDLTTQDFMMRTHASPGPGQYVVAGNVVRFCELDAGHEVVAEPVVARPD